MAVKLNKVKILQAENIAQDRSGKYVMRKSRGPPLSQAAPQCSVTAEKWEHRLFSEGLLPVPEIEKLYLQLHRLEL